MRTGDGAATAARRVAPPPARVIGLFISALIAVQLLAASEARAVDPVIAAAGDIACSSSSSNYNGGNGTADKCRQKYTSNLLVNTGLTTVLALGDTQYESASLSGLNNSYNPSWGRVKSITRPAPGNHEYKTTNAAGYFDYFNGSGVTSGAAGDRTKGYYSFDVGTWHLIALNSTDHCTIIPCGAGSAQETWLKADLAANSAKYCTLAFWHDPRFNSGHDGNADEMAALFQALYNADADVVLGGHAHDYERFAPQNPSGQLDNARGIRQFVVGTGGAFFTSVGTPKPNSQVRQNNTYGVLRLTLHPTSYDWQFVSESGKPFTDSGTGQCHGTSPPPPDTQKPSVPGNLLATAGTGQVALSWNASTDNVGVTGYRVFRGATQIAALGTVTSYADTNLAPGSYSYTVRAIDAAGNLSDPSNTASATVADTTKPSVPANLTATPGTEQVALGWQAATDDVGVTGYQVFRGATQVATLGAVTSWTDTNLAPGPYSYTVRAVDAAGNVSDPSNTANATVADTTKPTAPGSLTATAGAAQVALNWQASTDNIGVTAYRVFRGATQIASVSGTTSYTDTNLAPGPYSYTVHAVDAAGNVSDPSNTASATVPDTTKPSAPSNLTATAGTRQVTLDWSAASDNVGVTGYRIFRGSTEVGSVGGTTTTYTDTNLPAGPHSYTVRAVDAAANVSDPSNTATAVVLDTTKPGVPGNLTATPGPHQAALSWQAATDDVGVTGYQVYRGATQIATLGATTSYTDTNLAPGPHSYTVRAVDAAGNVSDPSNTATANVPDTDRPTAPANLTANAVGSSRIDLGWQASTDNVAVTGYDIYRDGNLLTSIAPATSYSDSVLAPATHTYEVRAHDAAGNQSDPSNAATASVTPPDTEAPTVPANLSATLAGINRIDLSWDASTDNVAVTGYEVYRDNALIATVTTTSYSDTTLVPGPYTYTVRAADAAGNRSDPSDPASVTIVDLERPTAPGNLSATFAGTRQIDLEWEPSTDNVAVTGYDIYRDGNLLTSIGSASHYSDRNVPPGTYSYEVRAVDNAGNVSDASNAATATVDEEPPGAPANLSATAAGSTQVDLAWEASSDNIGVTGYVVYRTGEPVDAIAPATSYSDTSVVPGPYSYEVRAIDAAGNLSDPSNAADVTVTDTMKPTPPANLGAAAAGHTQIVLGWEASSDDLAVTAYDIYRDGQLLDSIAPATAYTDNVLAPATHSYEVRARDAAGNVSDPSNTATATVTPPDGQAPTPPGSLSATLGAPDQVTLTWQASSDDVEVTGYLVYRGTALIATLGSAARSHADTNLAPGDYAYTVRAVDAAGNVSDPSNSASATVPDTQRPSAPANLVATAVGTTQVDLTWQAASDNVAVTGYEIHRDGALIATIGPATSWSDFVLGPATHNYVVKARDDAGNVSDPSNTASATVPDSTKPTAPGNLAATANGATRVDLTWQASTDNVAVTGYRIYRGGGLLATIGAATSWSDTSVTAGGTYTYEVRALDGAGNVSDPSNSASATTSVPQQTLTFAPEADAKAMESTPTTNYPATALRTDGGSNLDVDSFLRFTVSGATAGSVQSAKLRIYAYSGTVDGPAVYTTPTTWSETAITWNTRPARTSAATDDKGAIASNSWVEYDVTPFVTGSGTYSFTLATSSSDGVDFYSREGTNATLRPELVVTTGTPDSQPPTAPANLVATAQSATRVDLSWQTSSDNVAVTGYRIFRNSSLLTTIAPATSYSDTTTAPGTPYSYEVRAVDAAGNVSDPSNSAPVTTPAAATTLTIAPEADARVQEANPTTNYGTAYLRANGGTELDVESFLRFTVTGVTAGSVQSAKLRLYNYNGTVDGPAVYSTSTAWSETAVTWNTRPARTSAATDDKGAIPVNTWVEYDVTPFVTGSGTYSFTLATISSDGIDFYSRENATNRPELVLTLR